MTNTTPTQAPATDAGMLCDIPNITFTLEAMARNYSSGHAWDKLDAEACLEAARQLRALASQGATQALTSGDAGAVARLSSEGGGAPLVIAEVYRPMGVGSFDVYTAEAASWTPEERAAIWFHVPDQFRDGLNAQSANDVAMAVLRLQQAFAASPLPQVREQAALPCSVCNALIVERSSTHYDAEDLEAAQVRGRLLHAALSQGTSQAADTGGVQISDERIMEIWQPFILRSEYRAPIVEFARAILAEAGITQEKTNG